VALLLLGGNHDSVATLSESRAVLAFLSTTVVAAVGDPADHVMVLPKRGGSGEVGCVVCAVPFIRPRDVLQSQAGQSAEDKQQSLQAAIQAHYQAVVAAGRARQAALQREQGRVVPLIATGHLTTVGASSNESVREIYVGSLDAFPTAAFPRSITSRWVTSTSHRKWAGWRTSATAARPFRSVLTKPGNKKKCCWSI
jgi:exonuclease SbcD